MNFNFKDHPSRWQAQSSQPRRHGSRLANFKLTRNIQVVALTNGKLIAYIKHITQAPRSLAITSSSGESASAMLKKCVKRWSCLMVGVRLGLGVVQVPRPLAAAAVPMPMPVHINVPLTSSPPKAGEIKQSRYSLVHVPCMNERYM